MITLITNGDVYSPDPLGQADVLMAGDRILKVGTVDRKALDSLKVDYEVINAAGLIVAPGLIDPHEHLLGGSGEQGFATQTPEIRLGEIVTAGITTVVGCLGVDTTMKTMSGLLGRAKALAEEGLTALVWSGGYNVPPTTILRSVRDDVLFIQEVVGAGEVAIADERSTAPDAHELAKLVNDAHVGGLLSRKAGVTHFHVGEGNGRLKRLRELVDDHDIKPEWLYPTHVQRTKKLLREAADLSKQGCTVDLDTVLSDLHRWLPAFLEAGGDPEKVTASTDASVTGPYHLPEQLRSCVTEAKLPLEQVLAVITRNTARVLKLEAKGRIAESADADLVLLRHDSLEVVHVFARGKQLVREGKMTVEDQGIVNGDRWVRSK